MQVPRDCQVITKLCTFINELLFCVVLDTEVHY